MCDYSLEHVASREAAVADKLVSTSFSNTITRGFAAADDLITAVCLRPGTEIAFETAPKYQDPTTYRDRIASGRSRGSGRSTSRYRTNTMTPSNLRTARSYWSQNS